jgi:hypothetical protein
VKSQARLVVHHRGPYSAKRRTTERWTSIWAQEVTPAQMFIVLGTRPRRSVGRRRGRRNLQAQTSGAVSTLGRRIGEKIGPVPCGHRAHSHCSQRRLSPGHRQTPPWERFKKEAADRDMRWAPPAMRPSSAANSVSPPSLARARHRTAEDTLMETVVAPRVNGYASGQVEIR